MGLPWVSPVPLILYPKEECHESFHSRQNLDRLTQDPFQKNTVRSYRAIIERYIKEFGDGPVDQITPEQILIFLNHLTESNKPYTKRIRFSQLSSFFNSSATISIPSFVAHATDL